MKGCVCFVTNIGIMASFEVFEEDFGDLFLTQESREVPSVSLEDNEDNTVHYQSVLDPQYSDISDFEEEDRDQRIR